MVPPLEIVKIEKNGLPTWCETAATLDVAKAQIKVLAAKTPAQYAIFSHTTGHLMIFPSWGGLALPEKAGSSVRRLMMEP
jgi:hypothetical protein